MRDSRSIEGRLTMLEIHVNRMLTTLKDMQEMINMLIRLHSNEEHSDGQEMD